MKTLVENKEYNGAKYRAGQQSFYPIYVKEYIKTTLKYRIINYVINYLRRLRYKL